MKKICVLKRNALCACVICSLIIGNFAIADVNNYASIKKDIVLKQKEISKLNMQNQEDINKYFDLKNNLLDLQLSINDNKDAIKSMKEMLQKAKEQYGENSEETGYAYLRLIPLADYFGLVREHKEYLDKLYKITTLNTNNTELKYLYYRYMMNFYYKYEQPYNAIALQDLLKKYTNNNNSEEKLFYLKEKMLSKLEIRNFKNALPDIYNYYNAVSKDKNSTISNYIDYYNALLVYNIDSFQLKKVLQIHQKAIKLIKNNDEEALRLKIMLNERLDSYYISLKDYEKALNIIKESENLASNIKDDNLKLDIYGLYKDLYSQKGDKLKEKEYINKMKQLKKNDIPYYYNEISKINTYFSELGYYKYVGNYKKAYKLAKRINEIVYEYKDIIPVIYGNTLKELADIDSSDLSIQERINLALEAKTVYEVNMPANSYKLYELNSLLINLYKDAKEYNKAIECYNTAKNILINLNNKYNKDYINITKDIIEVYKNKGDLKKSLELTDEIILIAKQIFGNNNINVYELMLYKVGVCEHFNLEEQAKKLTDEITKAVNSSVIEGEDNNFYYEYYSSIAYKSLDRHETKNVEEYAKKAEKYANDKYKNEDLKNLNSRIKKATKK